ncbi:hypothetical protein Tco_0724520, partial [Tanacetum coccineum]
DYALWEIIEEGNSFKPVARTTTNENGTSTTTIPGPDEQKILKKNDLRAFQKIGMHVVVWRNKSDLGSISFDDLYNNFKIVEPEVKRSVISCNNNGSHNLAFLSGHSSTNDVNTSNVHVSTGSTPVSTASTNNSTACLNDAIVYAYLATQPNGSQVVHEDLEQIHEDDLDEMAISIAKSQENRNRSQDSSRRIVNVKESSSKAMLAIDGTGFDWGYMADEDASTNFALMAFSDSEGLASVEEQLVFYKKNKSMFYDQIVVLKRDASFNESDINALKKQKGLGYNVVPPPLTGLFAPPSIDLSNSRLEKFKQPEFEGYDVKVNKSVSETSSKEIKKTPYAPIIEDWVSDDEEQDESKPKSEKKTVIPTVKKKEFVKAKQDDKTVRNTVKYAEMYRSQKPRGNQRNWNNLKSQQLGNEFVMNNKACFACRSFNHLIKDCKRKEQKPIWNNARRVNHHNSHRMSYPHPKRNFVPKAVLMKTRMRPVNAAKPKAAYNAVKRNRFNVVKASACWVWMPKNRVVDHLSKNISASVTLNRLDYIDAQGRFKSVWLGFP